MKKSLLRIFTVSLSLGLLVSCSTSSSSAPTTANPETPPAQASTPNTETEFDPSLMPGMPCHKMGNTYMGDCAFDENGNVIPE